MGQICTLAMTKLLEQIHCFNTTSYSYIWINLSSCFLLVNFLSKLLPFSHKIWLVWGFPVVEQTCLNIVELQVETGAICFLRMPHSPVHIEKKKETLLLSTENLRVKKYVSLIISITIFKLQKFFSTGCSIFHYNTDYLFFVDSNLLTSIKF